jgi:type II secretory ATPase GspE/PulE/Tfp pilus assembly ATPase PilB-like protein
LIKKTGDRSGLEHAHEVLEEALLERASDVHIDPAEEEYHVRFRIDGIMQPRMVFNRDEGQRIVSALKSLAQIDVAEKRKAQDGRFQVRTDESDVDFRVATASSIFGEKVVIRILNRTSGLLGLGELGMSDTMREKFARVIHSRNGMILSTGPTGSGKTSTIYSALSQLDAARLNIMTIEDPVEYGLAGATQIPVNPKAGTTYESGLRSILRQDPDVIFVGEMRDAEAAQIALRAALTGHLVFSSLHTRDAIGTIIRLEEMGMDHHLLASSLLLVIAQRLLRVLCPKCREACLSTAKDLIEIGIELPEGETIYRPKGCSDCDDTGYVGRTGIFEMIVFDDELRQAVNAGEGEASIAKIARAHGFTSFREDGATKVLLGITSVEEVLQAS